MRFLRPSSWSFFLTLPGVFITILKTFLLEIISGIFRRNFPWNWMIFHRNFSQSFFYLNIVPWIQRFLLYHSMLKYSEGLSYYFTCEFTHEFYQNASSTCQGVSSWIFHGKFPWSFSRHSWTFLDCQLVNFTWKSPAFFP